ncbi:MAG: hypothetical protein F4218_07375 [Synechococcus sp. SB0677_bin_5]|nr:hypothetical protein [Synechococcus sp. SB0677_bin_5]
MSSKVVPSALRRIRPWVHTGWDVVVVAWASAHGAAAAAFLQDDPGALRQWQTRLERMEQRLERLELLLLQMLEQQSDTVAPSPS